MLGQNDKTTGTNPRTAGTFVSVSHTVKSALELDQKWILCRWWRRWYRTCLGIFAGREM